MQSGWTYLSLRPCPQVRASLAVAIGHLHGAVDGVTVARSVYQILNHGEVAQRVHTETPGGKYHRSVR